MFIFQHAHRGITYNRTRIEIQQTTDYTKRHANACLFCDALLFKKAPNEHSFKAHL